MARLRLSENTLESMGFQRVDLDAESHYMVKFLPKGLTLEFADGTLELAYKGYAVPLRCRGEEHLKSLIKVL